MTYEQPTPNYQWRIAIAADIGSLARFGDTDHAHEPWEYGILEGVMQSSDSPTGWEYLWTDSDGARSSYVCQIQYDGDSLP